MKQLLEFLGVLALFQGATASLYGLTGWPEGWGLIQRLSFFDGYELFAGLVCVVLAVALFAASGSAKS
ncbi:hypothetical protein [Streptomyces apocyni]|uniref:hypothetical protein n=1 Tax=Streptomyces apocyni TaxID=2654677 RepID=UPI0012EA5E39|nr:hypothetical protein [Streptomyces apocyni]